jgi:hypothetical protein
MTIEALKQALEAMKYADACLKKQLTTKTKHEYAQDLLMDAGVALRTAIETAEKQEPTGKQSLQVEQEPVAWEDVLGAIARGWAHPENARKPMDVQLAVAIAKEIQDMYTTPSAAQRQWVGLTDADKREFAAAQYSWEELCSAVEDKLKERNHD